MRAKGETRVKSYGQSTQRKCLVCYLGGRGVVTPSGELIREEEGPGEVEIMSSHSDQFGLSGSGVCWTPSCMEGNPSGSGSWKTIEDKATGLNEVTNGESTE